MKQFFLPICLAVSGFSYAAGVGQPLDYTDSLEEFYNPGRGFYRPVGLHLTKAGNKPASTWGDLVHLRVDIGAFSSNAVLSVSGTDTVRGKSQPLTEDAIDALSKTLAGIRSRGKMAVLRVCYDPWYNGASKPEPSDQNQVLEHLRQLAPVYNENSDVLLAVELGMYGPWGEMHTSRLGTNENIAQALQTLLCATNPDVRVLVRRPDIIATWMGLAKKEFVVGSPAFEAAAAAKGDTMFRAGMFNDGYLGSSSDLGTTDGSLTRDMMVNWLQVYSAPVPYGGELVANYNGDKPINTPAYLSDEGFRTHTCYLNYEWHQPTILGWKDVVMAEVDEEYDGTDGYLYVNNHLGYRFVLRNSVLSDTVLNGELNLQFDIQNVGFGNVCFDNQLSVVLAGPDTVELQPVIPVASSAIKSRSTASGDGTNHIQLKIHLPEQMVAGDYQVYLRLSRYADFKTDNNYQCIRFANKKEQYNEQLGANLVGSLCVNTSSVGATSNVVSSKASCWQIGSYLYTKGVKKLLVYDVRGRLLFNGDIEDGKVLKVVPQKVVYRVVECF